MANESNIQIQICSDLDYDNLIAEIIINGEFVGLISKEPDCDIIFEIPEGQVNSIKVPLVDFEKSLVLARKALLNE